MTTVILACYRDRVFNGDNVVINMRYSISVVRSRTLSNTTKYYKQRDSNVQLIVLKTYQNYDYNYKDNIYDKLKNVFNQSLRVVGRQMYIIKRVKLCYSKISTNERFSRLDKYYVNRIKMLI